MYVVKHRAVRMDGYGEALPVAAMIPPTQPAAGNGGQAVGLVLAFFSTLMLFASIMAQGDR